jgi:hypothetical protein
LIKVKQNIITRRGAYIYLNETHTAQLYDCLSTLFNTVVN